MSEVLAIWEARVNADQWEPLKSAFADSASHMPAGVRELFLVQAEHEPSLWRAVSVWDGEALKEYVRTIPVPGGKRLFAAVGVEATVRFFTVAVHRIVG